MSLAPTERRILEYLTTEEGDGDLLHATPGGWWYGTERTSGRVGYSLLRKCFISRSWGEGACDYYRINEEGRNALADPNYVPKIVRALRGEKF